MLFVWFKKLLMPNPRELPMHLSILCMNCFEHFNSLGNSAWRCPKCGIEVGVVQKNSNGIERR